MISVPVLLGLFFDSVFWSAESLCRFGLGRPWAVVGGEKVSNETFWIMGEERFRSTRDPTPGVFVRRLTDCPDFSSKHCLRAPARNVKTCHAFLGHSSRFEIEICQIGKLFDTHGLAQGETLQERLPPGTAENRRGAHPSDPGCPHSSTLHDRAADRKMGCLDRGGPAPFPGRQRLAK
jgi:hypothetical protein